MSVIRWWEWVALAISATALLVLLAISGGSDEGERRVSFQSACEVFCTTLESEVIYCNPDKKAVMCE
jgi:hypothetical protein